MYLKKMKKSNKKKELDPNMKEYDLNRLIQMAWQDRTTFDAIYLQYGLTENQVKNKMRELISKKAYNRWRKRVQNKATKHKLKLYHKPTRFQGPW
ncbi:TIGR03643 family protein [Malaciobacter mytili]|uniref:TIGR03643 family protein n=1 Tax=Malaciobacter mytili LMG 24559 TaxID=1032238 RepID=A0AAX2AE47_9BACT|nr:TIGR03643 family protein [Malaciobacter mytili]AXH14926.1 DUF2805 domain-containing protein [Malaciobacter mytili LMG 24559]RXK14860.1 TIGR03643 family protein [Malaciobacter mytili LMG 24559]